MSEIIGREIEVGFATEAIRGTAEATVDRWLRNVTANIVERAEHAEDDSSRGVLEDMQGRRVTKKFIEGDLEGIIHADAVGFFYASIYGKIVSTLVSGSVYDHVFTLKQDNQHQSLSIFGKDGGVQQLVYSGCMVNTFEINVSVDDYVRFTANISGQEGADNTATPSYSTEYDFTGCDVEVKIADTEAGLSGATAIPIKEITVSHDQGAISDHVLGKCTPNGLYNPKNSIEGEFTLNFSDEDYKDLYLNDTEKYMSVTIEGSADIGGGSFPTITYIFNKVMFKDWNREGGNDDLVTQPISFKAYYNETDGEASQVTLRNLTASYDNVPTS